MHHHLRHLLTPGTPGYATLKLSALAGVFALQHAMRRRAARNADENHRASDPHADGPPHAARPQQHSRSKKKKRRRRPH